MIRGPKGRVELEPGERFGAWVVLEDLGPHPVTHQTRSRVRCDCGRVRVVVNKELTRGASPSCRPCSTRIARRPWSTRPVDPEEGGRRIVRCGCGELVWADERAAHACGEAVRA